MTAPVTEEEVLRSTLTDMRAMVQRLVEENDELHSSLQAAEDRLEQSEKTVSDSKYNQLLERLAKVEQSESRERMKAKAAALQQNVVELRDCSRGLRADVAVLQAVFHHHAAALTAALHTKSSQTSL